VGTTAWESGAQGDQAVQHRIALLIIVVSLAMPRRSEAQGPTFDCAKAQSTVETLICKDGGLAALDRVLAGVYDGAVKRMTGAPAAALRTEQRGWVSGRNECWKADGIPMYLTATWEVSTVRACVEGQYQLRISELQATFNLTPAKPPAVFRCGADAEPVSVTFFETTPQTLRLRRAGAVQTLWQVRAASGARYEGQNIEFWNKGTMATLTTLDGSAECRLQEGRR
jgi:uncharacterized protein